MAVTPSPTSSTIFKFDEGETGGKNQGKGEESTRSYTSALPSSPLPSPRQSQQGGVGGEKDRERLLEEVTLCYTGGVGGEKDRERLLEEVTLCYTGGVGGEKDRERLLEEVTLCYTGGVGGEKDRERLLEEVTKLCRERHRLARLHRKAELRVRDSLARHRQGEVGPEVEEDGENWGERVAVAREALMAADKETTANQLHYKLMLEEAHTQAGNASAQATETVNKFLEKQRHLVQRSFSPLPPERDRTQVVETLLRKQKEAEEQLQQGRSLYFTLILRKQHLQQQQEQQRLEDSNQGDHQVSQAEMLQLLVETEAYKEEANVQESSLEAHRNSLKKVETNIAKQMQEKVEVDEEVRQAEEAVVSLQKQLNEERVKLKELCEKQARFRKSVVALQPNSRLKLDPLLAADLKEKLELRTSLEEELLRHKQAHGSGKGSTSEMSGKKVVTIK
ncbi:hypothetical protein Pcinc_012970 [Petrolisthes cinctipes]|uniref:Uncharacterized protein n=1 Tax=Petrolisthes cinctipes TaxID=88211 RepID=A0AAE1FXZ6_PETCI|nr:hypothetical protein Pcinc_012970 [Petrolisthes cinctipes]